MYCAKCGNTLPDDSRVCGYCGAVVADGEEVQEVVSYPQQGGKENIKNSPLEDTAPVLTREQIESLPMYSARMEEMVDLCSAAAQQLNQEEVPAESKNPDSNQEEEKLPKTEEAELPQHTQEAPPVESPVVPVPAPNRRVVGVDKRARPMRTAGFFGTQLLLLIPVINVILLFVWAFRRRSNFNRKAYARSILIWILIFLLILLAGLIAMIILKVPTDINYWIDQLKFAVNQIPYV